MVGVSRSPLNTRKKGLGSITSATSGKNKINSSIQSTVASSCPVPARWRCNGAQLADTRARNDGSHPFARRVTQRAANDLVPELSPPEGKGTINIKGRAKTDAYAEPICVRMGPSLNIQANPRPKKI